MKLNELAVHYGRHMYDANVILNLSADYERIVQECDRLKKENERLLAALKKKEETNGNEECSTP